MEYQYPEKGNYDYSQQQQYPPVSSLAAAPSVIPYPGPEQQGPPPEIMPAENQQSSYTYADTYSQQQQQYIPAPTMPEANQSNNEQSISYNPPSYNNNQYNPLPEASYNNNQYNPSSEVSYNNNQYNQYNPQSEESYNYNNQYNLQPEASYNNNQYNPSPEVSYNNNQYNPQLEASYNNNQYIPQPEPSYSNNTYGSPPLEPSYNTSYNLPPPQQTSYSNNSYNSAPEPSYTILSNQPPNQPPSYNNNVYSSSSSNASPYLTKPYSRTQNYNNAQPSDVSPPSAPPSNHDDKSPKPPKNYHPPSKPMTGPDYSSLYTAPHMAAPNQSRPALQPTYGGTKRPVRNNCDCADCFSICGCIRCTCTIITFIFAALFIAAGIFLISYSKILPGKCQGICDPTNGGIQNSGNLPGNIDDKINNEISNGTQQCSSLCKESVFKILFYGGIGFIGLGSIIALTQILCMCCRVGSSGGRGTGCCYCC
jgi:hypothetical protein